MELIILLVPRMSDFLVLAIIGDENLWELNVIRCQNKYYLRIQGVENTMCTKNELDQRLFLGFGHNWRPKPVGVKCHRRSK